MLFDIFSSSAKIYLDVPRFSEISLEPVFTGDDELDELDASVEPVRLLLTKVELSIC